MENTSQSLNGATEVHDNNAAPESLNIIEFLKNPLFWIFLVPLSVNLWKLFYLNYSLIEFFDNLLLDSLLFGIIIIIALINPIQHPVVYLGVFIAFFIAYITPNTPAGIWDWLGTLVVFTAIYFIMPHLKNLTSIILIGVLIAYMAVRVVIPLEFKDQAVKDMSGKSPGFTARKFLERVSDQSFFTLSAERFRFYMNSKQGIATTSGKMRRLHRNIHRIKKAKNINWIMWDMVSVNSSKIDNETYSVKISGRSRTTLTDDKHFEDNMIKNPNPAFPNTLAVMIYIEPIELKLKQQNDGTFRVIDVESNIDFDFERSEK